MQAHGPTLEERLAAYSLDHPTARLPFSRRLARENGWSTRYTQRVVREYKRFVLLAVRADQMVTPSDPIDQAWHLHLTYTQAYWQDFCRDVLGVPLHHGPTEGGPSQLALYRSAYARTLELYREVFGEAPPRDIWPPVDERFAADQVWQRVNTARFWLVPKPTWSRPTLSPRAQKALVFVAVALSAVLAGCPFVDGSSSLHVPAQVFLPFFAVFAGAMLAAAFWLRHNERAPHRLTAATAPALDAYEIAYLAGGASRTVRVALAALVAHGCVSYDEKRDRLHVSAPNRASAHPFEHELYELLAKHGGLTRLQVERAAVHLSAELRGRLAGLRLVTADGINGPLLLALSAPLLGAVRIYLGLLRDRPVGMLALLSIGAAVVAWRSFGRRPLRTGAGDELLASLQRDHVELRAHTLPDGVPAEQTALASALFGGVVLGAGAAAVFESSSGALSSSSEPIASADSGDGCGDGGCGGGCGGCGGCGG